MFEQNGDDKSTFVVPLKMTRPTQASLLKMAPPTQGVDVFGKRVGFVKFNVDVVDKATGKKVPGIVFARGPAVAVLILLESDGKTYGSSEKKSIGVANDVPTFNAENMQNNMKAVYYSRTRSKGGVFHPFML